MSGISFRTVIHTVPMLSYDVYSQFLVYCLLVMQPVTFCAAVWYSWLCMAPLCGSVWCNTGCSCLMTCIFKNVIAILFSNCQNFVCFILSSFSVHSINFSYILSPVGSYSVIPFYSLICSLLFLFCGMLQNVNGQVVTLFVAGKGFRPSFALV